MNYPGLYEPNTVSAAVAAQSHPQPPPPPPPPSHYFNNLPGIGYGSSHLAQLHQYLVAAHLAPLRGVPALPVHNNNSSNSVTGGSPLYKDNLDPVAAAVAAELERKRKRSDSGIEDSLNHKFVSDAKLGRYHQQQQQQHDQVTAPGHQSPAEMETVKKILETVNANVTRQLLEASVQRVKNAHHVQHLLHRPAITSSPMDSKIDEENRRAASISPNVTPGLEDMMEEVPDTSDGDQPGASTPAASHHQEGRLDVVNDDEMMREDAASETGTDDSGLVMALDQDCGQRDDSHNSSSNNNHHFMSHSTAAGGNTGSGAVKTASERTRSTISEDKAAVSGHRLKLNCKFELFSCNS